MVVSNNSSDEEPLARKIKKRELTTEKKQMHSRPEAYEEKSLNKVENSEENWFCIECFEQYSHTTRK
ncbi:unnamed protein product [Acanthoscelides obtectus]|uniref:Uncharacterized protein n=1 Tax=Acanthoscelides obtectus TaxID=200917 RepID=A0A9P0QFQ5_ACAOB|nr:unnamed protein product [Acanthoscelides obtectus]CAK1679556.1 hypothetical protein AOBTE_LOCUS32348 [Acanthoscelides obtectus]